MTSKWNRGLRNICVSLKNLKNKTDVLIIGAGGSGLMCSLTAGARGREVILLDHAQRLGQKILISGGGRCNFTNRKVTSENYFSQNPHFCKSALSCYTPDDFIMLVEKHGIPYHEKKLGQLFCDRSSKDILNMLLEECRMHGVTFHAGTEIFRVEKSSNGFQIETNRGFFQTSSLVIATGGLSFPKLGATPFGYRIAEQFGLKIVPPCPALDGFTLKIPENLSGISLDILLSCNGKIFRENILFTHKGLSGPAALQGSLYWEKGSKVEINLLPETQAAAWLIQKKKMGQKNLVKNILLEFFPKKLSDYFCGLYLKQEKPINEIADEELIRFGNLLNKWIIQPTATVGYDKAEVTRGGVSTDELSSKTMECLKIPNLYFVGEVVDVTGWLGGYNFQWAWASGYAAGKAV